MPTDDTVALINSETYDGLVFIYDSSSPILAQDAVGPTTLHFGYGQGHG